jgi:hypothetical protein
MRFDKMRFDKTAEDRSNMNQKTQQQIRLLEEQGYGEDYMREFSSRVQEACRARGRFDPPDIDMIRDSTAYYVSKEICEKYQLPRVKIGGLQTATRDKTVD